MEKISACVMTKNNEQTIVRCLESLRAFDEVLVLDTGSTDGTLESIAAFPAVRLLRQGGVENFGKSRNYLASRAKNDWILMVDSDEYATPELVAEIGRAELDPAAVYELNIINHFLGKPIRGCGWHPCYRRRLYHRGRARWKESRVHESLEACGSARVQRLWGELHHLAYRGYPTLLAKVDLYSSLWAEEQRGKRTASRLSAVLHGLFMFLKCYIIKRGIFYGYAGFHISFFFALGSFMKRMKLYELNRGCVELAAASPESVSPDSTNENDAMNGNESYRSASLAGPKARISEYPANAAHALEKGALQG
ncbi:MAG: glycosyltransferase family 2 protein [Pirellulales bacterium]|nr:glycosyltransferase family 2 protein [Pirellulales bacterium]